MVRLLVIAILLLVITGCSEPPQREIDQAQSALDAARAAGAERYASGEFVAASGSLNKAKAAVDQDDYRQALNYALDSRQRANEAARLAADARARAQRDAEAAYGEAATLANRLAAALRTATAARVPAKTLAPHEDVLAGARTSLQKASAAISAGNLDEATRVLTEVREKLDAAIGEIEKIPPPRGRRTPAGRR
jgi:hypothetical protein